MEVYIQGFNQRQPMFSCNLLRKRQHWCMPKIGWETPITNNLSSESSMDQI